VTKANLAPLSPSLRLQLVQSEGQAFPHVVWGNSCDLTASKLLAAAEAPQRQRARTAAKEFLRESLANGPLPVKDISRRADEAGVSWKTVMRAASALGVRKSKVGKPSDPKQHWVWCLPTEGDGDFAVDDPKETNSPDPQFGHLREFGVIGEIAASGAPKTASSENGHLRATDGIRYGSSGDPLEDGQPSGNGPLRAPGLVASTAPWTDDPWEAGS
jgi:hypothetical protein